MYMLGFAYENSWQIKFNIISIMMVSFIRLLLFGPYLLSNSLFGIPDHTMKLHDVIWVTKMKTGFVHQNLYKMMFLKRSQCDGSSCNKEIIDHLQG